MGISVAGTGMYVPDRVVTNDDLAKIVDTSDQWIRERTGIRERHFSTGEPTYYMAAQAAAKALDMAGEDPKDIDVIIGSTVSGDYFFPSMACILQDELGADNAFCYDISAACSGFIYALDLADSYISTGRARSVLIVCSDVLSKITDFTDRTTCILFGDGAGAALVKAGDGLFHSYLHSEGKGGSALMGRAVINESMWAVNKDDPKFKKYAQSNGHYITMDGREVYRFAVRALSDTLRRCSKDTGVSLDDVSVIVPHQANLRIIEAAAARLGVSMDKIYVNLDRYGNTSGTTIPMCLDELNRSGRLRRGDRIALTGFGAGLTCGAIIMDW